MDMFQYYKNNNRKFDIKKLTEKINHRGPDHTGIHKEDNIEFAFKILSIMDLENGSQPLKKDDKTIVFNGEIYNHEQLRNDLIQNVILKFYYHHIQNIKKNV